MAKSASGGWFSWLWPSTRKAPPRARTRTHGFMAGYSDGLAAAGRDRLTDDWMPTSQSPTSIHRMSSDLLLRRARDLVENNPAAKSGVESYVANVIGCGITPKPTFPDQGRRQKWVDAWNWWTGEYENECDLTGQQHFYELQALWLTEIIVGGGCLVRYVTLDPDQYRHHRVKLALELIPEERFADEKDDLVAWQNRRKAGNPIQRGVEFDQATGRTLAYWIRPAHPSDAAMAWEPTRLDARDCRYSFFKTRSGQRRGLSMLKSVVMWLWKLGYYVDNELMASAIKSCFAAGVNTGDEDVDFRGLGDDSDGEGTPIVADMNGNPLEKLEPGIIFRMRGKDAKITGVGPNTPTSEQEAWILLIERTIAIGMGLSYEEMFRDYSRGTFSSLRAGANRDRKQFRPMQRFSVTNLCRPTDLRFTKAASLAGIDGFPRPSQLQSDFDEWMKRNWRTEGWLSVNPWDDARAAVLEIDNGLGTRESYVSAKGGDWEENDQQQKRERESAEAHGLNFGQPDQVDTTQPGEGEQPAGPPAKRKASRAA